MRRAAGLPRWRDGVRHAGFDESAKFVLCGNPSVLASAEGDDAADGVVRRNADGHAITGNDLDSEAAHPAAELREYLMSLVALHAIQPAAVNRHDGTLHINQIILAQLLSFPIKDCAISQTILANSSVEITHCLLHATRERSVVIAFQ